MNWFPGTFPAGAISGRPPLEFGSQAENEFFSASNLATYTTGSLAIGTDQPDRVVGLAFSGGDATAATVTSVKIGGAGGSNMNVVAYKHDGAPINGAGIAFLKTHGLSLGANTTFSVTFNTAQDRFYCTPFWLYGSSAVSVFDFAVGENTTLVCGTVAGGVLVGFTAHAAASGADMSWSGSTDFEYYTTSGNGNYRAAYEERSVGGDVTSTTITSSSENHIMACFRP